MKKYIVIFILAIISISGKSQNENDSTRLFNFGLNIYNAYNFFQYPARYTDESNNYTLYPINKYQYGFNLNARLNIHNNFYLQSGLGATFYNWKHDQLYHSNLSTDTKLYQSNYHMKSVEFNLSAYFGYKKEIKNITLKSKIGVGIAIAGQYYRHEKTINLTDDTYYEYTERGLKNATKMTTQVLPLQYSIGYEANINKRLKYELLLLFTARFEDNLFFSENTYIVGISAGILF
jgi:hypothetical protein